MSSAINPRTGRRLQPPMVHMAHVIGTRSRGDYEIREAHVPAEEAAKRVRKLEALGFATFVYRYYTARDVGAAEG